MSITLNGYGNYFSSYLEVGDIETTGFYDYPGGVLTQRSTATVTKKLTIMGVHGYEVKISHYDCEPKESDVIMN